MREKVEPLQSTHYSLATYAHSTFLRAGINAKQYAVLGKYCESRSKRREDHQDGAIPIHRPQSDYQIHPFVTGTQWIHESHPKNCWRSGRVACYVWYGLFCILEELILRLV